MDTVFSHPLRALAVLFVFAGVLAACDADNPANADTPLTLVDAVEVRLEPGYAASQRYTGVVTAAQHDDIGFEQGGTLLRVRVDEGETVRKGQVLAELDTQLLATERRELQAREAELKARIQLNASNLRREQALKAKGFVADQRLDELRAEKQALAAALGSLRASADSIGVRTGKSRLVAPWDGVVTRRYRDGGSQVTAGMPVLRIMDEAEPEARIGVPPRLAPLLKPGERVTLLLAGAEVQARILALGADLDPVTRTLTLRVALPTGTPATDGDLLQLAIDEPVATAGAWVPITAIGAGMRGQWVVYALVQGDGELRVEARDVNVLHSEDERVFVSGSIAAGERLVASGIQRIAVGQAVRVAAAGSTPRA